MPQLIIDQGEYYKRYGEFFDNVNEYFALREGNPSLELPEPIEIPDTETRANVEDLGYAVLAKDSYQPIDERKDFSNYEYLRDDSNDNVAVYKSIPDNEIVYAIKGTSKDEPVKDFFRNAGIAVGGVATQLFDPTYYDHKKHIENINKKYSTLRPVVVGHSQGGSYASLIGTENPNYKTITYNMGTGFLPTGGDIKCLIDGCDNIKNYRIVGDWASSFSGNNTFLLRPKKVDETLVEQGEQAEKFYLPSEIFVAHGINQFIDRDLSGLKDDYGIYGRKLSRTVGGIVGGIKGSEGFYKTLGEEAIKAETLTGATELGLARQASLRGVPTRFAGGDPVIRARLREESLSRTPPQIAKSELAESNFASMRRDLDELDKLMSEASLGVGSGRGLIPPQQFNQNLSSRGGLLGEAEGIDLSGIGETSALLAGEIATSIATGTRFGSVAGPVGAEVGAGLGLGAGLVRALPRIKQAFIPSLKNINKLKSLHGVGGAIFGIGAGNLGGSLLYDTLFKPAEEELQPF